jgi:hypothetical protein
MRALRQFHLTIWLTFISLCLVSVTVNAAHRALLFNQNAMDRVLEMWPDFVETTNNQGRGLDTPGERALILTSPLREHFGQLLREQPSPAQFGEGFKILVRDHYSPSGISTFATRLNTADQISAFHYMLRQDGRLPVRLGYSNDLARQAISATAAAGLYEYSGVMWDTIEANPWLWLHGMSSEGEWDAPNRGCMGDDLPAKAGVDARKVKEIIEICPSFGEPAVESLMRGVRSGWRFAGVHAIGSHAIRIFVQKLEEHMKANPKVLTMDYVRNSRHGFAHGTLTGAVPDVVESMLKYNLYLPINVRRSLAIEPQNIQQNYGEAGWKFLAPIKTLIDAGANVVGEGLIGEATPETYFDIFDVHVNREISPGVDENRMPTEKYGDGIVYVPEEGVDRVVALKLFTYRSAEFLFAESKVGSLEVGKYADFIVTDKPYLSGADTEIRDNKVVMTVTAGENTYQDSEYKPVVR